MASFTWPSLTAPMTDRTRQAIQFWLAIGAMLVTVTLAWANLQAQVAQKVDRAELEALRQVLLRVDARTTDVWEWACQSQQRSLGCVRRSSTVQAP